MATIGVRRRPVSRRRISEAVWQPSIPGIWQSIRIRSKGCCRRASWAPQPFGSRDCLPQSESASRRSGQLRVGSPLSSAGWRKRAAAARRAASGGLDDKPEHRSFARIALYADRTAHQRDQARSEIASPGRAAELARSAGIGLDPAAQQGLVRVCRIVQRESPWP
jgi:hypothetical protein